jgi:hypothetical protein
MLRFNEIVTYKDRSAYQEEIVMLTPAMLLLLGSFVELCYTLDIPVKITSITEKIEGRTSTAHEEGRAVDISVREWSEDEINYVVRTINEKHKDIAAISSSDLKPRAAIVHSVFGRHIHLQVKPQGENHGKRSKGN